MEPVKKAQGGFREKMKSITSFTSTVVLEKYDRTTQGFIDWVRNVPLESDAVSNLPKLLREYDSRKTTKEILKMLYNKVLEK